jgi:hypothetical protein
VDNQSMRPTLAAHAGRKPGPVLVVEEEWLFYRQSQPRPVSGASRRWLSRSAICLRALRGSRDGRRRSDEETEGSPTIAPRAA